MKKFMKKLCALMIALGMMTAFVPFTAYAAEGKVQFSDPTCEAGQKIDINLRVITEGNNLGAYEVKVKYDPKMMRFEEGSNATASNGIITVTYDGGNVPDTLHILTFTALKNGDTNLTVDSYDAKIESGEELTFTTGSSAIKIEGGTPIETDDEDTVTEDTVSDLEVEYKDQVFYIVSDFSDEEVPEGFEKSESEYNGQLVSVIVNEISGQQIYLGINENGDRVYLFDDTTSGTLRLAERIPVNKNLSIFIMDYPEDDKMPENIKPTTMTLNDKKFAIWNNIDNQDFYYVYAFSSEGTKGYYVYDSAEQTYQRANVADFIVKEEAVEEKSSIMNTLEENVLLILIAAAALIVIFIIIIIVLAVKLNKRGKQLNSAGYADDVDFDDEIEDDVNDYDENDVYDVNFDDYDDGELDFDESFDSEFDDEFDDDFAIAFDDEAKTKSKKAKPEKKKASKKVKGDDDDFSIDFIEL